jgi:hypothetical protein
MILLALQLSEEASLGGHKRQHFDCPAEWPGHAARSPMIAAASGSDVAALTDLKTEL